MGISTSSLLDDQKRLVDNNWQEARDALHAVNVIAQEKDKVFRYRLARKDEFDFPAIPIDKVLFMDMIQRAAVENEAQALTDEITKALGSYVTGAFLDSITRAVMKDLEALFGNYSGNDSEVQRSLVSISPTLGVFRIDYYMYSYRFQSEMLRSITNSVTMVAFAISSVDLSNVSANTCNVIVSQAFGNIPADQQKTLAQDLIGAVEKSKLGKASVSVPGVASAV